MNNKEFAAFLAKLKEKKIKNKQFAVYADYDASSICQFSKGKRPIPKLLGVHCSLLNALDGMGFDIKKMMKL